MTTTSTESHLREAIEGAVLGMTRRGVSPQLFVDATDAGVEVPEHVREQWRERLWLNLNPAWPIALAFDDEALYADLGFQGVLMRCRFPYHSVWAVFEGGSHEGLLFEAHVPATVRAEIERAREIAAEARSAGTPEAPGPEPPETRPPEDPTPRRVAPNLRLVKGGKSG